MEQPTEKYIYVYFDGENFKTKLCISFVKAMKYVMRSFEVKDSIPMAILDEHGNVIHNKKELISIYNKGIEDAKKSNQ